MDVTASVYGILFNNDIIKVTHPVKLAILFGAARLSFERQIAFILSVKFNGLSSFIKAMLFIILVALKSLCFL